MSIYSILAIFFLFWVFVAFIMLPFGVRTHDELGQAKIPGQADSAPANFRPGRLALRAAILAAVLTALWVLNWNNQWVPLETIDVFNTLRERP